MTNKIIAISPPTEISNEAHWINQLLEEGLYRYHIAKDNATEQSLAELLSDIEPKFLSQITLHSHFHLVLAFGVGGIHFSRPHRQSLKQDYLQKVQLYQGFGIKVSTSIESTKDVWSPADYAITFNNSKTEEDEIFLILGEKAPSSKNNFQAIQILTIDDIHNLLGSFNK